MVPLNVNEIETPASFCIHLLLWAGIFEGHPWRQNTREGSDQWISFIQILLNLMKLISILTEFEGIQLPPTKLQL